MSVEYSIYLVNWKGLSESPYLTEFLEALSEEPESSHLYTLSMDIVDVLDRLLATYFKHKHPKGFLEKIIYKCDVHLAKLSEAYPEILKLDQIMGHLNWGYRHESDRVYDLNQEVEMMETALNPTTVQQFALVLSSVDYEKIRPRFEKHQIKSGYGGLKSFDELIQYGKTWELVLRRGATEGKGLIVYVYG